MGVSFGELHAILSDASGGDAIWPQKPGYDGAALAEGRRGSVEHSPCDEALLLLGGT